MGELRVRVQARARRGEVAGERDGALLVRVTSPPVDGRANREACSLLAARLSVARGRVSVARGATQRDKLIRVDGLDSSALRSRLDL
ncbi:MAG TPA: DUF167 domain-containing protein [Thermoleophilaceae bacterium]|jgi:hypothetical protein